MKDRIRSAFGDIQADGALLAKTAAYLQEERAARERKQSRIRPLRLAGALAAVLVLVVGMLGYRGFYYSAAAYVSIDVNPSLELTLNPMDKVIAAAAYNADGEAILRQAKVNGRQYGEAVSILLAEMESQGYVLTDALVTMTVQTADGAKEQALCDALLQSVSSQINPAQATAEVEVFPVTREVRETAYDCHMSAAKYLAIQELMEVDETATLEGYTDSTIRQIRQRTQACREGHGNGGAPSGNENHGIGQGQSGGQHQGDSPGQGIGQGQSGGQHQGDSTGQGIGQGGGQHQGDSSGQGTGQGGGQHQGDSPGQGSGQGGSQHQGDSSGQGIGQGGEQHQGDSPGQGSGQGGEQKQGDSWGQSSGRNQDDSLEHGNGQGHGHQSRSE